MKLSDCCGAEPRGNGDTDTSDFGICSDCREHCEYVDYCDECHEEIKECVCEKIEASLININTLYSYE